MFLFGCTLKTPCTDTLLDTLKLHENSGFDALGCGIRMEDDFLISKGQKRISLIREELGVDEATSGICHARWATCGNNSPENAHPFSNGLLCVAANGTIDNADLIRSQLNLVGTPDCDSAILPHLLAQKAHNGILPAITFAMSQLSGTFSFVVFSKESNTLYAANHGAPLYAGIGENGGYISSEVAPLFGKVDKLFSIDDGECVQITTQNITIYNSKLKRLKKPPQKITSKKKAILSSFDGNNKIFDIPTIIESTLSRYIQNSKINLKNLKLSPNSIRRIYFCGCGSSYQVGLAAAHNFEAITDLPCYTVPSGEFCSSNTPCDKGTLFIAISASGETAETVRALKYAKKQGAKTIAVTTNVLSRITRESRESLFAGIMNEKMSAASSFGSCYIILCLLAIHMGVKTHSISEKFAISAVKMIETLPDKIRIILKCNTELSAMAQSIKHCSKYIFIGQNIDFAAAGESALKLSERLNIPILSSCATELRHTNLCLIDEDTAALGLISSKELMPQTIAALRQAKIRGAKVCLFVPESLKDNIKGFDIVFGYPDNMPLFNPVSLLSATETLAQYIAKHKEKFTNNNSSTLNYYAV